MTGTSPGRGHPRLVAAPAQLEVALRALRVLGEAGPGVRLKLVQVGEGWSRSRRVLARVLGQLAEGQILDSRRGTAGGYALRRPLEEVTVLEVFEALQAPSARADRSADGGSLAGGVEALLSRQLAAASVREVIDRSLHSPT